MRTYTDTEEHGWVCNEDGWVESLDPPRDELETHLVTTRCRTCHKPAFELRWALQWDSLDNSPAAWCIC